MANRPKPIKLPGSFHEALSDLLKVKPPPVTERQQKKKARLKAGRKKT
jgi:hypothetical protein